MALRDIVLPLIPAASVGVRPSSRTAEPQKTDVLSAQALITAHRFTTIPPKNAPSSPDCSRVFDGPARFSHKSLNAQLLREADGPTSNRMVVGSTSAAEVIDFV
jgi:hypothetical protein